MEEDEISNNPNFHSEDQEEFEIPEGKLLKILEVHFLL